MSVFLQTIVSALSDATLYLLLSVGLTLMFGVLGVVNFAQGDFMTVAAYVGFAFVTGLGLATLSSLLVMIPALMVLGAAFYYLVLYPTESHAHEARLLATFGVAFVLQGVVQRIWSPNPIAARQTAAALHLGDVAVPVDLLINLGVATLVMAVLYVFLNRLPIGREIRATAQDSVGAELIGIDTTRVRLITCVLACGLTACGGLVLLTTSYLYPQVGFALVFKAFAVVIVAGLGSVWGVVAASLMLGLATEMVATYVSNSYTDAVAFVVIIIVLLERPSGILGASAA